MKLNKQLKHGLILSATLGLLFACGGGDDSKSTSIVAFGDSLTDGGTYKNGVLGVNPATGALITISNAYGGGRFTTNGTDALTWAEVVAKSKGLSMAVAGGEGFSQTYSPAAGGNNYAQGGSRVKLNPGIGNDGTKAKASALDVSSQVARYLAANASFPTKQLVLLSAGANDVFFNTDAKVLAAVPNPQPALIQAAKDLAALAKTMQANGAQRLVIANLPDMGKTPAAAISGQGTLGVTYALVDSFTWLGTTLSNASANGITNTTTPACNVPAALDYSSLFCGPAAFVVANADMTYAFADAVHPTTKMHQLYGAYAMSVINAMGW
jgi:phospholipase/lecithinase/hemolysin